MSIDNLYSSRDAHRPYANKDSNSHFIDFHEYLFNLNKQSNEYKCNIYNIGDNQCILFLKSNHSTTIPYIKIGVS